jgi:hypothetical protein
MSAKEKYKDVTDTLKILQINENAICDEILNHMKIGIAFKDADKTLGEIIYYGSVFESILESHNAKEIDIPTKYLSHLNDMIELVEYHQYVMVTKV